MNTRCIYYRVRQSLGDSDNLALCPILDFANHSWSDSHIFPVINSEIWGSSFEQRLGGDFTFISRSDRAIEPGEELFLRYGGHPNHKLFTEYGFVKSFSGDAFTTGDFVGEVNTQDILETLFEKLDTRSSGIRTVLEEEGYWGLVVCLSMTLYRLCLMNHRILQ